MRLISVFLSFLFLVPALPLFASDLVPVEHFARLPDMRSVKLSPDGKRLAGIITYKGESLAVTQEIETGQLYSLLKTDNERAKFNSLIWGNDERLLISFRAPSVRYGTATMEHQLLSIKYDGSDQKRMFRPKNRDRHFPQIQNNIVDLLPDDPDHFLLALNVEAQDYSRSVYRTNINSGSRSRVQRFKSNATDWVTDQNHRPRIAITFEDIDHKILGSDPDGKNWRTLWEFSSFSEDSVWPLGFGLDPNILFVRAYHEGRYAVFNVDLSDPDLNKELIVSDAYRDVSGSLIYSPKTGEAVGVYYSGNDGLYYFWDEQYKSFLMSLEKALPDTYNRIIGFSRDERRYLIRTSNDTQPGTYLFGDRDTKTLSPVAFQYPELNSEMLSPKKRVVITARDGLEMDAYLTLPKNAPDKSLPTIINPHGGPISRDSADFDYWTQFFSNRGYAVLQVNFRGSSGYGIDYMRMSLGSWGLSMQDDLEDSTKWLIDEGISDAGKICIVGGSYGGYAALMGAAKTPDLYACAISFAGLSDLNKQLSHERKFISGDIAKEQFGTDLSQLRDTSPRRLADAITAPILLAHGDKDRVVPVRQSRLMRTALRRADKEFEYIEFDDGDHYLSKAEHRLEFFKAMDTFLAKHIGGVGVAERISVSE